ncbi:MAG: hypothetical protein VZR02_07170 [Lachnospiraceae bacterium]|nr:hypothetical protein [Lachnospiraceae bacterium]
MFNFLKQKFDPTIYKTPTSKIVLVAYDANGHVPNFEKARYFMVHVFENDRQVRKQMMSANQGGVHTHDLLEQICGMHVDAVVAGFFDGHSLHELKRHGIKTYVFDGGPGAAAKAYRMGSLEEM